MEENTKNTKNTKKIVLGVVLFAVVIAVLFGCWKVFGAKTTQGAKSYTLTVQDDKGDKKVYEGYTDAEYVRGALEELEKTEDFTLEGSVSFVFKNALNTAGIRPQTKPAASPAKNITTSNTPLLIESPP